MVTYVSITFVQLDLTDVKERTEISASFKNPFRNTFNRDETRDNDLDIKVYQQSNVVK